MNCLLTTMKVVLPLFLMIGTGFVLKEKKLLSEETAKQINKISFSTFIPLLVFNNIRNTRLEDVLNYRLFAFTVASILVMWGISNRSSDGKIAGDQSVYDTGHVQEQLHPLWASRNNASCGQQQCGTVKLPDHDYHTVI